MNQNCLLRNPAIDATKNDRT